MFMETPQTLLIATVSAFVLGWVVAKIGAYFGNRFTAKERDPRDDRIRSMDAELRVARSEAEKAKAALEKTRELRAELSERATENLKSEVKLREVETELSVAQASTDLLATGVLDYSVAPDAEDDVAPRIQQSIT